MRDRSTAKTLVETPKAQAAFWIVLGICALVRIALWTQQEELARFEGGVECAPFVGAEEVVRERKGKTRVLVLGSSRMRDGVVPALLAQQLSMSNEQVTNAAYAAGTVFDLLLMLRRDPNLFDRVELVIVDAEPWSLNDLSAMSRRTHFLRYATLAERFAYRTGDLRDTAQALGVVVWPYLVERRPLINWFRGPATRAQRPAATYVKRPEEYAALASAQQHMAEFRLSSRMTKAWRDAAAALSQRGIRMLVVQPPAATAYFAWIKQHRGGAYQQYRTLIEALSAPKVLVKLYEMPADIGLQDDAFVDYGHFALAGAEHFTRHVATLVQQWVGPDVLARSARSRALR